MKNNKAAKTENLNLLIVPVLLIPVAILVTVLFKCLGLNTDVPITIFVCLFECVLALVLKLVYIRLPQNDAFQNAYLLFELSLFFTVISFILRWGDIYKYTIHFHIPSEFLTPLGFALSTVLSVSALYQTLKGLAFCCESTHVKPAFPNSIIKKTFVPYVILLSILAFNISGAGFYDDHNYFVAPQYRPIFELSIKMIALLLILSGLVLLITAIIYTLKKSTEFDVTAVFSSTGKHFSIILIVFFLVSIAADCGVRIVLSENITKSVVNVFNDQTYDPDESPYGQIGNINGVSEYYPVLSSVSEQPEDSSLILLNASADRVEKTDWTAIYDLACFPTLNPTLFNVFYNDSIYSKYGENNRYYIVTTDSGEQVIVYIPESVMKKLCNESTDGTFLLPLGILFDIDRSYLYLKYRVGYSEQTTDDYVPMRMIDCTNAAAEGKAVEKAELFYANWMNITLLVSSVGLYCLLLIIAKKRGYCTVINDLI